MKKDLLRFAAALCMLLFFGTRALAQTPPADTTLSFSKIILYDLAGSGSQSFTVPSGKVWKVESVSMGSSGTAPGVFLRNGVPQNIAYFSSPVNAASASYPFWLPDGFSGSFLNNNASSRCTISITEYTKTP
ncbi:MAG: hypothetical protein ACJ77K_09610 [Bacteroidia bacterium]